MPNSDTCILIPAYKPDDRLNKMIDELLAAGFTKIVTVDDGGGSDFAPIFEKAREQGAVVLTHEVNRGKGAALKTGLSHIGKNFPMPVVTADADGQHAVKDIARVAQKMRECPEALVLGSRDKKQMPPRSKAGNTITCVVMGLVSGLWISDTQTGLRGIPASRIEQYSTLEGDRYEFEMNMLLDTRKTHTQVEEVTIETIYIDDNKSSHFNTVKDSARIYWLMLRQVISYLGSALCSGIIDWGLFALLHYLLPESLQAFHVASATAKKVLTFLLPSGVGLPFVIARLCSSVVNYKMNRDMVFKGKKSTRSVVLYYVLVLFVMVCGIRLTNLFTLWGLAAILAKPIADLIMFLVSYNVQKKLIFR